ncbi:MAG: amino acid--tRNA ligase-related protein, partial [Algisphaera sp.]
MPKEDTPSKTTAQLLGDRRQKLKRLREEFHFDPYGQRTDGLIDLSAAREQFSANADSARKAALAANLDADPQADPQTLADDRPSASIAGRVVQHRVMGNLIFMVLRDHSGDLQVGVSKKTVGQPDFGLAKMTDYGDIVTATGKLGTTKTGEITLWAGEGFDVSQTAPAYRILTKSLALPPNKHQGLTDPETRYRKRYVDLYANPDAMATMKTRSRIIKSTRDFFTQRDFLEVETPMMQAIPGGAAARPFETHHNALDIDLFLRIAPELYLKRLLVAGMPKVFEINRNFRNEGIDRSHNPEFTMLELYEAYGDLYSVMDHTEQLFKHLAESVCGNATLPYGDTQVNYAAFARKKYLDLFNQHNDFDHT